MQTFAKEKVIYTFSPEHPFVYEINDGEEFCVEMNDCYNGVFKTEKDLRTPAVDTSRFDAAVGPIRVNGAEAGDVLRIDIKEINFAPQGVMVTTKGLGIFGDKITEPNTKIIKVENGKAHFSDKIVLPLTPMIGVLGVLPKEGCYKATTPGNFGGNMDTKEVTVGTTVYLPVFLDGAGLAVADLHACMGDGEMSGTGLEIGGSVRLKVTVVKGMQLERPLLETADSVYTVATEAVFEDAFHAAAYDMVKLLMEKLSLNFPDAYRLLSATCDIKISQLVNGVYTLKCRVPKYVLENA